jgi:Cu/Ag efflux protein CusF
MKSHRPESWLGVALFLSLMIGTPVHALQGEQLAGVVSSIDLEGKKIVVTPTGKEKPVDVTVNDQTVIQTPHGKKLALKELKTGDGLGISHTAGVASKIVVNVKPDELTGHIKSIGANLKTFVVTETGTSTDVTVALSADTTIVTTAGKKIEMKELKKGDGVGISHVNSVASKVVVNVKPVE